MWGGENMKYFAAVSKYLTISCKPEPQFPWWELMIETDCLFKCWGGSAEFYQDQELLLAPSQRYLSRDLAVPDAWPCLESPRQVHSESEIRSETAECWGQIIWRRWLLYTDSRIIRGAYNRFLCMEATYSYVRENQLKQLWGHFACLELVLYGIRELA